MLDDGTANSVGLILLFVGLGYCLLWFFEDRTARRARAAGHAAAGKRVMRARNAQRNDPVAMHERGRRSRTPRVAALLRGRQASRRA